MASPTGIGAYTAHPRQLEKRNSAESIPATPLPASNHGRAAHTPSLKFSGAGDALSKLVSMGNAPEWMQKAFLFTSKEGASAVLPLEGAVVAGRTNSAYRRDGWMEVQERVFEEVAAAVIWLKGVDFLKNGFKSGQNKFLPQYKHLSPDIAWNRPWGKVKTVDLTAQELFAKNRTEINSLLRLKSARWLFSVGLALAGVAYVVPTLNQLKTQAIMSYQLSRRKRSQEGDNVQFGDPVASAGSHRLSEPDYSASTAFGQQHTPLSPLKPDSHPSSFNTPFKSSNSLSVGNPFYQPAPRGAAQPQSGFSHPFFGNHAPASSAQGPLKPLAKPLQFGAMPGGSLVQGLGHMVDQTAYGSILVVDAGIAGGRSYVASKRSAFETVEVLVRDIGSLYFYILSVPHIMKGLGWAIDSGLKTSVNLEPKVADRVNEEIKARLQQGNQPYSVEHIKAVLHGSSANGLLLPEGALKTEMRTVKAKKLADWLKLEARAYLGSHQADTLIDQQMLGNQTRVMPEQVQAWLDELATGKGPFQTLKDAERKNLSVALKQAFRHTVGMEVTGLKDTTRMMAQLKKQCPGLSETLNLLNAEEATAFGSRIQRMARIDALDQAHSLFRRSVNLLRDKLKEQPKGLEDLKEAESLADWLDNAKSRHLTLEELSQLEKSVALHKTGPQRVEGLMAKLTQFAEQSGSSHEKALLQTYKAQLIKLLNGDTGRLFSLAIDQGDEGLSQKLREMLQGGLHNDTAFLRKAQQVVGQFTPDSRDFADSAKAAEMRASIGKYGDALLGRLKNVPEKEVQAEIKRFLNLNRNLNYASRSVALLGTMFCLGWLVPHVQTTITKRLTGKDRNPGIASAANALGYGKDSAGNPFQAETRLFNRQKDSSTSQPSGTSPNGVFVGQTTRQSFPSLGQAAYQS
ncbi:hypothetical protein [Vampirovibrio sp.]|uniref:hypothetical protein n=1 Tax=Vampirovibrio sp. TaxID=2717857 RepID=UPI00359311CD